MRSFCVAFCVSAWSVLTAFAWTVEGSANLSSGSTPQGIQVIFEAASPTAQTDTAVVNRYGNFELYLQPGWYQITYQRLGFAVYDQGAVNLRADLYLPPVTLMPGICGRLNGTVGPGSFHVTDSLYVAAGETATLASGTQLFFDRNVPFWVEGQLVAIGTEEDSILFSRRYATGFQATWHGLSFRSADESTRLQYVIVEHATKVGLSYGGGLYCSGSGLHLTHSTLRYNHADIGGGAFFEACAAVIESCAFVQNVANGGAGLSLSGTAATVTACFFQGNSAYYSGGGLYAENSDSSTIRHCQFVGNSAFDGAGAAILAAPVRITECVFTQNMSPRTAALLCNASTGALISRCTMASNQGMAGAAFSSLSVFGGTPVLSSLIIAEPSARFGVLFSIAPEARLQYTDIFVPGGFPIGFSSEDSINGPPEIGIQDTLNARGDTCDVYQNITLDPEFVDAQEDFHLNFWSPCINTGDPELQDDPDSSVADMGAFYYIPAQAADPEHTTVPRYKLLQNYPNPFNGRTQISFELPRASDGELTVYDLTGRLVTRLLSGKLAAGRHEINWDAADLPSGVYVYRLRTGEILEAKKMILLK